MYTFNLRKDAKWSNGTSVVADQFVEGLRRAVDPKTASGSAALLVIISGANRILAGQEAPSELAVRALDPHTIQIRLEHPAPYLLQLLAQPIAAPVYSLTDGVARNNAAKSPNPITNGAYSLVRRVAGSQITLSRNAFYWDVKNVAVSEVSYLNAESESTELREYLAGQLDMTFTIPMPDLERVLRDYPSQVQMSPILGTFYLALNLSELPLKNSKDLRQALSMTVEREAIAEHVMMGVTPAYSFVAKGVTSYVSPEYEWAKWTRDQRLAFARRLFTQAGYSAQKPLHLKLYFNRDDGIKRIMTAVAAGWKNSLGVESELISEEFRVFLDGRKDRKRWDVARLGWNADFDDPESFLDVFSSGNGENDPKYKSDAFDDLVFTARGESQPLKRLKLFQEAEKVLLNDYPIIPVYFYEARRLVKPYLGGAEISPMNHTYTKHLYWKNPQ